MPSFSLANIPSVIIVPSFSVLPSHFSTVVSNPLSFFSSSLPFSLSYTFNSFFLLFLRSHSLLSRLLFFFMFKRKGEGSVEGWENLGEERKRVIYSYS